MSSVYVSEKYAALTANATAGGEATIASNVGWLPGCSVWLSATGETSLECTIIEQVGSTKVKLRRKDSKAKHGFSDLSAYTTAKGSALALEGQVVAVRGPFEPFERA